MRHVHKLILYLYLKTPAKKSLPSVKLQKYTHSTWKVNKFPEKWVVILVFKGSSLFSTGCVGGRNEIT